MDVITLAAFVTCALIVAIVINVVSTKKRIKRFELKLRREFGQVTRKEADPSKKPSHKGYFFKHYNEDEFFIDEITWNDAEGETLFNSLNKCLSSCGEEYLYYSLRHPDLRGESEDKDRYVSQTDALMEDEELRVRLQMTFARLGKTGKYSVYDYISLLGNVKRIPLFLFYLIWLVYILIIPTFFISITLGVCLLVTWAIVCIIIFLFNRKNVEEYVSSFEYVVRTLMTSEKIVSMKVPIYDKENEKLIELRKKLKGIKSRYLSFIKQSSRSGIADMASGATSILNSFLLIDLFLFHKMLRYIIEEESSFDEIFSILGKMESQISVANLKANEMNTCVPEFVEEDIIEGEEIVHPLIKDCVSNSLENKRGVLITGSNASGKSTFLRSVLVNAILSESVYLACAKSFKMKPSLLFSSMSLNDSLESGESYYMVEINSIKRIIEAKESGKTILCFLDEVLRGTNTVERVAAAGQILKYLSGDNIITLAATHDIELTYILEDTYDNYFYREEIVKEGDNEDIYFSYKMHKGRSETRNALKLLKLMGYPDEIYDKAEKMSANFQETGKWE